MSGNTYTENSIDVQNPLLRSVIAFRVTRPEQPGSPPVCPTANGRRRVSVPDLLIGG
jgi:hypothetical protein